MKKKKLHLMILCVVIVYAVILIVISIMTIILPSTVYDNPKLLSKNLSSANKKNYKMSRHDGITTITCGKMQGMDIIWEYEADEDIMLQMYYNFDVTIGRAKIVLIQPDGTVIILAEQNSTVDDSEVMTSAIEPTVALDLKKGRNKMKIVCEKNTSFSLSFRITE